MELLPEPRTCTGDLGSDLAVLLMLSVREDAKIGEAIRASEERMQQAAEAKQIEAMEAKSDSAYAAGLIGGFSTAGAGLANCVGAARPGLKDAMTGTAQGVDGTGKILSAWQKHGADDADTDATHQGQLAGRHARAANDARDEVKDDGALIDRIVDLHKEYLRTKAETQRAAILRA